VLFADVVHSMDIAAALGPERLRGIMAELFDVSAKTVQRYGGTIDKFTGDGVMAIFGAPLALEDHAIRGCRAALGLQREVQRLAEAFRRDGVDVQIRVGLNSGEVVAGELGSGPLSYTAFGEQVGMAQRMESVAPPGGVMITESTARLVEDVVELSEPEAVTVKGRTSAVMTRRLLRIKPHRALVGRTDSPFIGRTWEMPALSGTFDGVIDGCGGAIVGLCGPAGIGKSRIAREMAAMAATRGVEVFEAACESHARELPFQVVAQLLRAAYKIDDDDAEAHRARIQAWLSDVGPEELLLLGDLLGINDPEATVPRLDPDARRRRLTELVNSVSVARRSPALYIIEDAHWIDEVSESMLADFMAVIPRTQSMVLITYRPEYRGALARMPGGRTIDLAPLSDSESAALIAEQLGVDDSVAGLAPLIADRAAGNPFFVKEIVRDLAERGVLHGKRGSYTRNAAISTVHVPPTLHATIAARIDRLGREAKRTLNAAAVIGSRFAVDLLTAIGVESVFAPLVDAHLVDQVTFSAPEEYVFHHPLIRQVAYESQLVSDRVDLHRRLADAIRQRNPASVDENAALIAEHLEAAMDMPAAYEWHMRAAAWSTNRDITAARTSWQRARQVADGLPADDPERLAMRIAAGTLLCATAYRSAASISDSGFQELRDLCEAAGDKRSLALTIFGQMTDHMMRARVKESSELGTEQLALLEAIDDRAFTVGLSPAPLSIKQQTGEMAEILRWSQVAIDAADGDALLGNFVFGSPLALALVFRGAARCWLGVPGWRKDFDESLAMARRVDPVTFANCVVYKCNATILSGVLRADDVDTLRDVEEAFRIAADSGDHSALGLATYCLGGVLLEHGPQARARGRSLLADLREMCARGQFFASELSSLEFLAAREMARDGDLDGAIPPMSAAVDDMFARGQFMYGANATPVLVETLLRRGDEGDLRLAEEATDRLADAPVDGLAVAAVILLRLRALLARARGDDAGFGEFARRYRREATALGFEGHIANAALA
jgi:class 3 adenylate cyclase